MTGNYSDEEDSDGDEDRKQRLHRDSSFQFGKSKGGRGDTAMVAQVDFP